MHATLRRLRCAPGKASDVAQLIEAEYVPQLTDVDGVAKKRLASLGAAPLDASQGVVLVHHVF